MSRYRGGLLLHSIEAGAGLCPLQKVAKGERAPEGVGSGGFWGGLAVGCFFDRNRCF